MEQSSPSVVQHHFQLSNVPRKRCRNECDKKQRKENCCTVEADAELGLADSGKLSRGLRQALPQRRVRVYQIVRRYPEHPVSKVRTSQHNVLGKPASWGSHQNDAASGSEVWLTDAKMSELAVDTNQDQSFRGVQNERSDKESEKSDVLVSRLMRQHNTS